jgi:hypothetical protein
MVHETFHAAMLAGHRFRMMNYPDMASHPGDAVWLNLLAKVPFSGREKAFVIAAVHNKTPLVNDVATKQGRKSVIVCCRRCDFDI